MSSSLGSERSRRVVEVAILGFALFSPWSIAGAQICLALGLMAWVVRIALSRGRGLVGTSLGWPIAAFLLIGLISAVLSPNPLGGLRSLRSEWTVLLFFLVVNNLRDRDAIRRAVDLLVAVTTLVGLYAIWQHFAGWDLYRDRPLRATGQVFEATGVFGHHLTFGGYVMVILIVVVCLFLWGTRGRRRMAYGMAGIILGLALVFSYARSAWLGLFGGVLLIGALRGRKILLAVLAVTVLLALLVFLLQPSVRLQVREAFEQLQNPMVTSSRVQLWSTVLRMIADHPWLGVGPGQVRGSLVAYGCDLGYSHPHNDLLNQASNVGLLGLAAFLWIWVAFLRRTLPCHFGESRESYTSALALAGFGLMLSFLLAGLFQCYYTDAEDGMILWFLLGLVTAACRSEEGSSGGKKKYDEQKTLSDGSGRISSES